MASTSKIPQESLLNQDALSFDFVDSYANSFSIAEGLALDAVTMGRLFLSSGPTWMNGLFTLRNKVASLFGLKTAGKITDRQKQLQTFAFEPGHQLGLFKVFAKTEHELVLGQDDKHLNFRVSLLLENAQPNLHQHVLSITTAVTYQNNWGRAYFFLVKPFHQLIVPAMLRSMMGQLPSKPVALAPH